MKKVVCMPEWLVDLLFVLGAVAICVGLGFIFAPLAFLAAGVFLLFASWRGSRR